MGSEDGDLIAARLRIVGKGRSSGAEGTLEWGGLFEMRDGQCVRITADPTFEQTLGRLRDRAI